MNLDPTIMQGLLVGAGVLILFWPSIQKAIGSIKLPTAKKSLPTEADAFVDLLAVRDALEANGDLTDEESDALEVLTLAIIRGGR